MRKRIGSLLICGLLLAAAGAGQEPPAEESQAELIERIEELQGEIEEMLAKLPPEVREALRQRLAAAAEAVVPEADAGPATETVVGEPDRTEALAAAPPWSPPRRRPPQERCNTLQPLDESGDGAISSADRYWRYVYVWLDGNTDGQMQEREIESVYDQKIREIDVSLETFTRAKGGLGEIRITDRVVLDLRGDGFSERSRRDDGVLLLDAKALRRGDGPELLGPEGETLDGFQLFRAGLAMRDAGGRVLALNCPGIGPADD